MKSIRRAILGNQEYHHNLLDGEFESLVKEATDKHLMRPDARVNRNVILAINDPNTGMELTPTRVSQQLRKVLRSAHPRKQWLATVLTRDVLTECRSFLQPVLQEILDAVSVLTTMNTATSSQLTKDAKHVAIGIMGQHRGNKLSQHRGTDDAPVTSPSQPTEPKNSIERIWRFEQSCHHHCEVIRELVTRGASRETNRVLIRELLGELKRSRQQLAESIEALAGHNGTAVENAVTKAFHAIDAADKTFDLHEKSISSPIELTLRRMSDGDRHTVSRSLAGERSAEDDTKGKPPLRSLSSDLIDLNILDTGLKSDTVDPFQSLANGEDPAVVSSQPPSSHTAFNPFANSLFLF